MRAALETATGLGWRGWGAVAASAGVGVVLGRVVGLYGEVRFVRPAFVGGACLITLVGLITPSDVSVGWSLAFGWALLTLGAIDVVALRLPNILTAPLALLGLVEGYVEHAPLASRLAGALIGWLAFASLARIYEAIRRRPGLGLGDGKLLGACGAWLGVGALPNMVLLACGVGLIWAAVRMLRRGKASAREPLPFGAPLALAAYVIWARR